MEAESREIVEGLPLDGHSSGQQKAALVSDQDKSRFSLCENCWEFFSSADYKELCYGPDEDQRARYNTSKRLIETSANNSCAWCSYLRDAHWYAGGETHFEVGLNYHCNECATPQGRNLVFVEVERGVTTYLSLTAEPNDPIAEIVTARKLQPDINCFEAYAQVERWLAECDTHSSCRPSIETNLPTLLIDVYANGEHPGPRLVEMKESTGKYVALSYCWGPAQTGLTTRQNVGSRQTHLEEGSLSQTVQDAIRITRLLGYKYLWVDAICIIQDSEQDMARELGQMSGIFQNAVFTIVAANAASSNDGFLTTQTFPSTKICDLPFWCADGQLGLVQINRLESVVHGLSTTPISKRAWTLQEALLSPRLLIYASHTLQYCCNTHYVNLGDTLRFKNAVWRLPERLTNPGSGNLSEDERELMMEWVEVVKDYSKRETTFIEDRLPALSAIAQAFSTHLESSYLAGLWTGQWLADILLWSARGDAKPFAIDMYVAPTWSWASLASEVSWSFADEPRVHSQYDAEFLETDCTLANPSLPFGKILAASILVNGHVRQCVNRDTKSQSPTVYGLRHTTYGYVQMDDRRLQGWPQSSTIKPQVWFLVISSSKWYPNSVNGLVLRPTADGKAYRRVGMFKRVAEADFAEVERQTILLI